MAVLAFCCRPTHADDFVHLQAHPHEVSSVSNVEYTLVPVVSLAFAGRSSFIFQRTTDESGKERNRVRGQYSLKRESGSDGKQVLRVYVEGKQTEYGVLEPADDPKIGPVLVYTAKASSRKSVRDITIIFKLAKPNTSHRAFLKGFLTGIEEPDRKATNQMLETWFSR